jgi:hypothetical protein
MKQYPSLDYWTPKMLGEYVYAFDKLDGSNLRFEWSSKRGWYKFGTRNVMIDENNEQFGKAIPLFLNKYGDELDKIFRTDKKYRNSRTFTVFGEYLGENSFAGQHDFNDEMDLVMFDVVQFQKGFVKPKDFINDFSHLHIPDVIYSGEFDLDLVEDVKSGKYDLKEGVMVKGVRKTKGNDIVWIGKIKTNQWLDSLKDKYGEVALIEDMKSK